MAVSSKPLPAPASGVKRCLPRTWRGWLLAIFGPIILLLVILYVMARMTPPWYEPLDASSQSVIDAADLGWHKVVSGLHNSFQRVPLGDQLWTISQTEVNSILAIRVPTPEKAEPGHEYPVVSSPFVLFADDGKVTIATRTTKLPGPGPGGGVASITFSVKLIPTGPASAPKILVQMESAYAGRLRIPRALVESRIRGMMPTLIEGATQSYRMGTGASESSRKVQQIEMVMHAIERGEAFEGKFSYDGRVVVVKHLEVSDGSLSIIFGPAVPPAVRPRPLAPLPPLPPG